MNKGNTVEKRSYDAWGRLRKPNSLQPYGAGEQPTLFLGRGYTGHEHLPEFGLINMNARMYDPILGRFLSPDPYIADGAFSQDFNRYSYVRNNPLMYTDPNGELLASIFGVISDLIDNIFIRGPINKKWDWSQTKNGWQIDMGLIRTDPNKQGGGGRLWQLISRHTWEMPQTLIGYVGSGVQNMFCGVRSVTNYGGATVVECYGNDWEAVTFGSYIMGRRDIQADPNNSLFQHEYGHYLQSQEMGLGYIPRVGFPSLLSEASTHKYQFFEQDANRRAFMYFNENVEGFYKTETEYRAQGSYNISIGNTEGWNFYTNPLDVKHTATRDVYYDYRNSEQLSLVNSLSFRVKWYDYFSIGIINGLILRNNRVK